MNSTRIGIEGKSEVNVVKEYVVSKHKNINHKQHGLPFWNTTSVVIRCYTEKAAKEWETWLANSENFFSVRPWGDGALYSETGNPCPQEYGEILYKKSWDFTLGNDPVGTFYVA